MGHDEQYSNVWIIDAFIVCQSLLEANTRIPNCLSVHHPAYNCSGQMNLFLIRYERIQPFRPLDVPLMPLAETTLIRALTVRFPKC